MSVTNVKNINFARKIGIKAIDIAANVGNFTLFCLESFKAMVTRPIFFRMWLDSVFKIGYLSLPVIGLTAIFTGAVLALQSYNGFARFNAESSIATVVVLSITRELGPVLGGLMFAARVGSSIAAEIGAMRVTEQISAMKTLSVSPMRYIIAPRMLAGIFCLPILVIIADIIGVMGGYIIAVHHLNFASGVYIKNTIAFLTFSDVMSGVIKAVVFGFVVTGISCYNGYNASGGAEGVGRVTINSVVSSAIAIFFLNYIITSLLF